MTKNSLYALLFTMFFSFIGISQVVITENLYNSGSVDLYKNTAYKITTTDLNDLSTVIIDLNVDFINIYYNVGNGNERFNVVGSNAAGKSLKEIFETIALNGNPAGLDLTTIRQNYIETFRQDSPTGSFAFVNCNVVARTIVPNFGSITQTDDLYSSSPNAINTTYNANAQATLADFENYFVASDIDELHVYTNDGTQDIQYTLTGVANFNLNEILTGNNDQNQIIPITNLVFTNVGAFNQGSPTGPQVLVPHNFKAVKYLVNPGSIVMEANLYNNGGGGVLYQNTIYTATAAATLTDYETFVLPVDIDWLNVYVLPSNPNGGSNNRIDLTGVAGKNLKEILTGTNTQGFTIPLTDLRGASDSFREGVPNGPFAFRSGFQLKAVNNLGNITPGNITVTNNLFSVSQTSGQWYENVAYDANTSAVLDDFSFVTLASDIAWINVYWNDGTTNQRYDLLGVAGKNLKDVLLGNNDAGIIVDIAQFRHNYQEVFQDGSPTGTPVLIPLNVKSVKLIYPTNLPVVITCVADITVYSDTGSIERIVVGTEFDATAVDNDGVTVQTFNLLNQTNTLAGETLGLGTHTIVWFAGAETCTTIIDVIDIALGVEDNELSSAVSIYPNPAIEELTISNQSSLLLKSVIIYTVDGRKVSDINLTGMGRSKNIDISNLAPGVYFVRINGEQLSTVKRLIKK